MKAFVSYAHDDYKTYKPFRLRLDAIEQALDIDFWDDKRIRAGDHGDDTIRRAINAAKVFIPLLSPAFIDSDYIQNHEMPAIRTRAKAVKGLICPVILQSCPWEPQVRGLQAIPSKENQRVVPIADWKPRYHGYQAAQSRIEAAILSRFGLTLKTHRSFDRDPSGRDAGISAAAEQLTAQSPERATAQLQTINSGKATAFAAKIARSANSLGPKWQELLPAARNLAKVLRRPKEEFLDYGTALWEGADRLASFLEPDKLLLLNRPKDQNPLPDDILWALGDLIRSLKPLVRQFPTARALADEGAACLANPPLFASAGRAAAERFAPSSATRPKGKRRQSMPSRTHEAG